MSNVLDQFLAGHATTLEVELEGRTARISDDGEGLPFGQTVEHTGEPTVGTYLTTLHAGSSAAGHAPHVHRNDGVGLAAVNALSSTLRVRSLYRGQVREQSFTRGVPDGPERMVDVPGFRGTMVEFTADSEIWARAAPRSSEPWRHSATSRSRRS